MFRTVRVALATAAVTVATIEGAAAGASLRDLPGTYQATYPVLFSESEELLQVEKFLTIRPTQDRHLFIYNQCWRLVGNEDFNQEQGGLVITSGRGEPLEFLIVEAGSAPIEGSTGFFQGRMVNRHRLDVAYAGLDRGIVFRMEPRRTEVPVDESSCPLD